MIEMVAALLLVSVCGIFAVIDILLTISLVILLVQGFARDWPAEIPEGGYSDELDGPDAG